MNFFLTDFKFQLRICAQLSQHHPDYGIITAHSLGMTVWRKPYFFGVGYRVGPSRICILIGIIWLKWTIFFSIFINKKKKKEKLLDNLAHSANFTYIFSLSNGLFSNSLFYSLATYFCISAHPLLIFLLLSLSLFFTKEPLQLLMRS